MNAITQGAPAPSVESLSVITYQQQPVVTTELLAQLYGTESHNIIKNFNSNADRFIDGKHFIKLEVSIAAPETEIDRQKHSLINRRAIELSHRAYETYRDQMRTCPRILGGPVEIEQWLPPELAGNIVADAQRLAAVCDIFRENISKSADTIARMAGLADE